MHAESERELGACLGAHGRAQDVHRRGVGRPVPVHARDHHLRPRWRRHRAVTALSAIWQTAVHRAQCPGTGGWRPSEAPQGWTPREACVRSSARMKAARGVRALLTPGALRGPGLAETGAERALFGARIPARRRPGRVPPGC